MKISMPDPTPPAVVKFMSLNSGDCFYTDAGEVCMRVMGPFDVVNTAVFKRDGVILRKTHDLTVVQKVEGELKLSEAAGQFKSPVIYERGGNVPPRPISESEAELVKAGRKIDAIRAYRERNGASLLEAKDATDAYLALPEVQEFFRLRAASTTW